MRACARLTRVRVQGFIMAKEKLYFKYLRNEQNEQIEYKYKAPVYGESNTDISFYEPNASRIANMYRSASSASKGVYDFDDGKERDIRDCVVPVGRKPGLTFEEISQMQTDNNNRIKLQARKIEEADADAEKASKEALKQAVKISDVIRNPDSIEE